MEKKKALKANIFHMGKREPKLHVKPPLAFFRRQLDGGKNNCSSRECGWLPLETLKKDAVFFQLVLLAKNG